MVRNIGYRHLLSLAFCVVSILFQGCKDDVFNPEKVKATYQDKFPVKDIDPQMDWKMTHTVTVHVSVFEDIDQDYTIRIYDSNPLSNTSAKILAEGTANSTTAFSTTMDCPAIQTDVFVCRTDNHQRNVVKYVSIENGQVNVIFGTSPTDTRAASTRNVTIETYSPGKSEAEIRAMLTNAVEIKPTTSKYENGKVYKISKGKVSTQSINEHGLSANNPAIIIIEGEWQLPYSIDIQTGFHFYVLNGGKITYNSGQTLTFSTAESHFTIYEGGTLSGGNLALQTTNDKTYNYNAGTFNVNGFTVNGTGTFYNCGIARIGNLNYTSGGRLINQGKTYLGQMNCNSIVQNACYLEAQQFIGQLYMGNNTSAKIAILGFASQNYNTKITMGDNSMITATQEAQMDQIDFFGPSAQYALVKIKKITSMNGFQTKGNLYYEVQEVGNMADWEKKYLNAIKNTNGTLSKWGEAPIFIPEGDCTGSGNESGPGSVLPSETLPYTYVFEDNFPLVGDYDFNDVVLDVRTSYHREKPTNYIKRIQLDITLAAAGASKPVGVGLRIIGIDKSDIREIETGGDDSRFQASFEDPNNKFKYNEQHHWENGDEKDVVIPIAGEVHNVFGEKLGTLINTGDEAPLKAYTYEVIIELKDQKKTTPLFSKDNLDFFICYQYQSMKKRMEVHLYEFWKYGATAAGTVQQANLDLAGNNTWAICVPYGFRYPKERINISRTDDPLACAYPDFIYWAKDRNSHQDWYKNSITDNVYRR